MNYSYLDWITVLHATSNGKTQVMVPISVVVLLHASSVLDVIINHPC
jgi:hypothetical protein